MDRHSTGFYFSIWEIGRKRKCFLENQGDDRRWGIPRREFKREISSRFQSQRSIDEENINFFIGKDRFCRGGANYRKKCEGQRGSDGNEDVRTRLVRCQTLTNATALTVNAIQFVFPSLLASVSRNWLRTPRLDLFPLIYIYIYMILVLQLFFCPRSCLLPPPPTFEEGGFHWNPGVFRYFCLIQYQSCLRGIYISTAQRGMIVEVAKFRGRNAPRFDGIHKLEASHYPHTANDKL